jgi:hypothetical protein
MVIAVSTLAGAVLLGCTAADDNNSDGGAGTGGSGGTGGTGGAGGTTLSDGAIIDTGYVGCLDGGAPMACPTPPVTYAKVEPIFQARCANICHNGMTPDPTNNNIPFWSLKDYQHVSDWRDTIRQVMVDCSMPPADAGVPLTVEERWAILEFLYCGLPK